MEKKHKFSIWYVLLGIWLVLLFHKVGQVYFARQKRNKFLNVPMEGAVEYSEATAELIDNEVREIINNQYSKSLGIIRAKSEILKKGAEILLEQEKIEKEELKGLMEVTSTETS